MLVVVWCIGGTSELLCFLGLAEQLFFLLRRQLGVPVVLRAFRLFSPRPETCQNASVHEDLALPK